MRFRRLGCWVCAVLFVLFVAGACDTSVEPVAFSDAEADMLVARIPGLAVETEVALLGWLADEARWEDLTEALNASMVQIPGGWGQMGTSDGPLNERPRREVLLDPYWIDRYEVTNLEYASFVTSSGSRPPRYWPEGSYPDGAELEPVVGISWAQASSYCQSVGKRLPTEAEWERACAGPEGRAFPWGDRWASDLVNVEQVDIGDPDLAWAWLAEPIGTAPGLRPVGSNQAGSSQFGVCNMGGNAAEWVEDWYDPDAYSNLSPINPIGTAPPWSHAVRGGSWIFLHSPETMIAEASRCAARNASHSADDPRVGFRCAKAGQERISTGVPSGTIS